MSKRTRSSDRETSERGETTEYTRSGARANKIPRALRDEIGTLPSRDGEGRTFDSLSRGTRSLPDPLDINDWMDTADASYGGGGGGVGSSMPMIFPKIYVGASRAWSTEVYIVGGATNNLNTYDLYNLACAQLALGGVSYAAPLTGVQDERVNQIQALIHSINVVGNNTNTVVSVAPQYSGDGSMPSIINAGDSATAPSIANETLSRPNFLCQRQELQLPTTGASMSSVYHNYDASPHNRPWFLDTNVVGRAYAAIEATQILDDGAPASWVAFVKVTFRPTQPTSLPALMLRSNADFIEEMNKAEAEHIKKLDFKPTIEDMNDFRNEFLNDKLEAKKRLAERKKKVRLERELGINTGRDF